jgi:hypothetical protein
MRLASKIFLSLGAVGRLVVPALRLTGSLRDLDLRSHTASRTGHPRFEADGAPSIQ